MTTKFKLVLDKRRANKKGLLPVRLRVFQGRNSKDFSTNLNIVESAWDEVNERVISDLPNSSDLNETLEIYLSKLKKILKLAELEDRADPTLGDLVEALKRMSNGFGSRKETPCMFEFGYALAKGFADLGRVGNSTVYTTALNRLKSFTGNKKLSFVEVDYKLLCKWETSMLKDGLSINGIDVQF